jgi:hypothetical protein
MLPNGEFISDEPETIWATEKGPDRNMKLLKEFTFIDPHNNSWIAPKDSIINGASIPRALWTLVGSPYTGDYRRASIVHDIACEKANGFLERRAADRMFYHACRAGGCSIKESTLLYLGVRIGAFLPIVPQWSAASVCENDGPRSARLASEERLEQDFRNAAEIILLKGETDDPALLEKRTDEALAVLVGLPLNQLEEAERTFFTRKKMYPYTTPS